METGYLDARCSPIWTIKKFSSLSTIVGSYVASPPFSPGVGLPKFCLKLYPNGANEKAINFLSLTVRMLDEHKNIKVQFDLSLLNRDGSCVKKNTSSNTFTNRAPNWGYTSFISRRELVAEQSKLLSDDTLRVQCDLWVIPEETEEESAENFKRDLIKHLLKKEGFWQQYVDQQSVDVTSIVEKKKFNVHKTVMEVQRSRVPVLARMFEAKSKATIKDCQSPVFEAFIKWLYLGEIDKKQDYHQLLIIANKYDDRNLKMACEKSIYADISKTNAIETLLFADQHKATWLKKETFRFITSRAPELYEENRPSLQNNPELYDECIEELSSLLKTLEQKKI